MEEIQYSQVEEPSEFYRPEKDFTYNHISLYPYNFMYLKKVFELITKTNNLKTR